VYICYPAAVSIDKGGLLIFTQVGIAEMRPAIVHTGGLILLSETFEGDVTRSQDVFRKSLQRMFARDAGGNLNMCFGAQIEVLCSRENKVLPPSLPIFCFILAQL
jgi:hypothetical protein